MVSLVPGFDGHCCICLMLWGSPCTLVELATHPLPSTLLFLFCRFVGRVQGFWCLMWRCPPCGPLAFRSLVRKTCIDVSAGSFSTLAPRAERMSQFLPAMKQAGKRTRHVSVINKAPDTPGKEVGPAGRRYKPTHHDRENSGKVATGYHDQLANRKVVEEQVKEACDPATVVRLDSRRGQLYLNPMQRELIWNARRREYQHLLMRIVLCLESHLLPIEKCHTLLALHEEVIEKRIRLRADTYEDVFHVFYAVVTMGDASSALGEEEAVDCGLTSSLVPAEFSSPNVVAASLLTGPLLQSLWTVYRYMIDSGTNPTPRIVQYLMGILERYRKKDAIVEARAHSLIMDLDRFSLAPTEYSIASYIGVCDINGVMHLAVARVTDYRTRHERQASGGIFARLLFGLVHNHQYDEAVACVTTMDSVAVTPHLLNAILNAARHSRDPLSAFTFYKSLISCQRRDTHVVPSSHTISILLEVIRETQCYDKLDFLLCEMQRYRIKGNSVLLNRLLEIFLKLGRHTEATALRAEMERKAVVVFDELR